MCGIVGYVGRQQAVPVLLQGLYKLEYRGYDSAGVALLGDKGLQVVKTRGRIRELDELLEKKGPFAASCGIGHTRWATHGAPSDVNSHPHLSEGGKFAVIHNGIIETYADIKDYLIPQGVHFRSETDTEVVAQLLEFYYNECHDFFEAVGRVLRRIEGAYALGMLCEDCPGTLIAARKDAPLLLGYGEGESFIASDVTALLRYTREVSYMEDGEVAVLTEDGVQVFDALQQPVEKERHHIDWEVESFFGIWSTYKTVVYGE